MIFANQGFKVLLLFFLCSTLLNDTEAHSYLLNPKGDYKSYFHAHCRMGGPPHAPNDTCSGPCIEQSSWMYDKKAETYQYSRGEKVDMIWPRNNHVGGFVRFSLVPEHMRMDREAHKKLAFRYSCFNSGEHDCLYTEEGRCGTDTRLHRATVEIPKCYPDGNYVLSWAWYGGLSMNRSFFGDYYSCTYIRIKGGEEKSKCEPKFIPGINTAYNNSCNSAVNELGICKVEPCLGYNGTAQRPSDFTSLSHGAGIDIPKTQPILKEWIKGQLPNEQASGGSVMSEKSGGAKTYTSNGDVIVPSLPRTTPHPLAPSTRPAVTLEDAPVKVVSLKMINTGNDDIVAEVFENPVELRPDISNITFVAVTTGEVRFVSFFVNNSFIRREQKKPFACWGDSNGKYKPWPNPIYGEHNIRVETQGENGKGHSKNFKILLQNATEIPLSF